MSNVALALATSLALAVGAQEQSRPDFSGSWRLDRSRSDAAVNAELPGPVTLDIVQSDTHIQIATTTPRDRTEVTYGFVATDASAAGMPVAQWRGEMLLTDAIRDLRGQSVTVQQSWRLSADANELVVESVVNVQHGYSVAGAKTYGTSRDVFVRTRPDR